MLTYIDLFRRLRQLSLKELQRPVVIKLKSGVVLAKSLYVPTGDEQFMWPEDQVMIDTTYDQHEETKM